MIVACTNVGKTEGSLIFRLCVVNFEFQRKLPQCIILQRADFSISLKANVPAPAARSVHIAINWINNHQRGSTIGFGSTLN